MADTEFHCLKCGDTPCEKYKESGSFWACAEEPEIAEAFWGIWYEDYDIEHWLDKCWVRKRPKHCWDCGAKITGYERLCLACGFLLGLDGNALQFNDDVVEIKEPL